MQIIESIIISDEVWNTKFSCDLIKCQGKCCQYGDLGAPISEDEEETIKKNLDKVFPYLPPRNKKFLLANVSETYQGNLHIKEIEENTPCPLAYVSDKEIVLCSLHTYALENEIPLLDLKPLWCSLFPLIIKKTAEGWIINLHIPEFCVSEENAPPVLLSFESLLASIFGKDWIDKVKKLYIEQGVEL